jgi:hypothetical protein
LFFTYFGPFLITKKIGTVTYRLKLPDHCTIHLVFHVSQRKKCVSNSILISSTLPDPIVDVYQVPTKILDTRRIKKGEADIDQVLVQWPKLSHELAMWEDKEALQQQFPRAPVWGQLGLQARGVSAVLITTAWLMAPSELDGPVLKLLGRSGLTKLGQHDL